GSVGKPIITKIKCCIHDGFVYFPLIKDGGEFLYYVFAGGAPYGGLGKLGTQLNLNTDTVGNIVMGYPPPDEQAAIVRFLDAADRRIRRYIRAKQKLIKLLNEQKQAIIQRAVTRGLDTNVPMKDSGIEWLGEIPAHWESKRAKYYFREVDIRSTTGQEELLSVSHITGVTPRSQKNVTMFKSASYVGSKICQSGDLVINTMWAWMGAMGVSLQTGIVSPSYGVYRPKNGSDFLPGYLDSLLRTKPYVSEYVCRSTGIRSSRLRLYPEEFLRIPIVKPSTEEQQAVLSFLKSETSGIDGNIDHTNREIGLIREYRTRLIADVVTGKVDVRGVAFELPEDFDEDNLLDVDEDEAFEDEEIEEVSDAE
ncbi:MAG: restriction endonuclease subunit S, partial [Anaerolineae bacterium]|nr:restriction endonuclease subunit S [Anaerolineae bacterium]